MFDKKKMKLMAMKEMAKEGPMIAIKIKRKMDPMAEMEDEKEDGMKEAMDNMMGEEQNEPPMMDKEEAGYVSFMVSPEERKMLLDMRKGKKMEHEEEYA